MNSLIVSEQALEKFRRLPTADMRGVLEALARLQRDPTAPHSNIVPAERDIYLMSVGDIRVVFKYDKNKPVIQVLSLFRSGKETEDL
jgi:mRNA-degrading endonuclease RelE of RelBE toxin-antitoxin system